MSEPSRADAVIIGGGIVGCGAALGLAQRGLSVILLEKGAIAGEQSSRNWGWVRQNGRNLRELPLGIASRKLWEAMDADLQAETGWIRSGNIDLAYDEAEMELFARWRQGAEALGLETEILTRAQVEAKVPGIAGAFVGGIHSPTDGQADPHRATAAMARAAAGYGAGIRPNTTVTAIRAEGGRVTGVETSSGSINAETVVVAAGAWSSRLLRPLGLSLPQRSIRSTVLATTPVPPVTRLVVWAEGVAFRQDHRGRFILAGGGRNEFEIDFDTIRHSRQFWGSLMDARRRGDLRLRAGRRLAHDVQGLVPGTRARRDRWSATHAEPQPSLAAAWATLQNFRRTMPALAEAGMQEVWAGNIDYTPDAVPVIEAITRPSGVVIATGFSGHGFALGPIGGCLAARLAAGEPPGLDLDPFRLARFAEGTTHEHELHF